MAKGTEIVHLDQVEDYRDVVHRAVQALVEGGLVGLPTESVYGVAALALKESAVERLWQAKRRPDGKPLSLAIKSADEALDYVPDMSRLGQRLARRCWPGPVTLVFETPVDAGMVARLPTAVRQAVAPQQTVGLRVSAHPLVVEILRLLPGPLVLTSANRSGEPDATTAEQVRHALGDFVGLVLDDGPTRYGQPSTVVHVSGQDWRILRAGVVPERTLRWLVTCNVLFVCTGNTCRSPLAEGICRKLLADQIGCPPEELPEHGWQVASAGIAAVMGCRPSPEAVDAARRYGVDLNDHISQPLTRALVQQSDYIFVMTQGHRDAIELDWPEAVGRVQLLARDENEIPDPIGAGPEEYHRCAKEIESCLRKLLPELKP